MPSSGPPESLAYRSLLPCFSQSFVSRCTLCLLRSCRNVVQPATPTSLRSLAADHSASSPAPQVTRKGMGTSSHAPRPQTGILVRQCLATTSRPEAEPMGSEATVPTAARGRVLLQPHHCVATPSPDQTSACQGHSMPRRARLRNRHPASRPEWQCHQHRPLLWQSRAHWGGQPPRPSHSCCAQRSRPA